MVEGVKRRNEQSGKSKQGRGTGEGGKRAWKFREEGEGGEGGSAKERVESVGRMTVRGSLARAQRSNGLWQPRRGMLRLGGGSRGWLSDIISVVVRLDFLGGPAKGKVDWNPLNV